MCPSGPFHSLDTGGILDWVLGALAEGINVLQESTVNLYMPDGLVPLCLMCPYGPFGTMAI